MIDYVYYEPLTPQELARFQPQVWVWVWVCVSVGVCVCVCVCVCTRVCR